MRKLPRRAWFEATLSLQQDLLWVCALARHTLAQRAAGGSKYKDYAMIERLEKRARSIPTEEDRNNENQPGSAAARLSGDDEASTS